MAQRLSKVLAQMGVTSRRKSEGIIADGRVQVNGETVLIPETSIEKEDIITLDGRPLSREKEKVYFALNKPPKYLCSPIRGRPSKQVVDLFADQPYRVFTVGRLDKDTTGLLIVTNDGDFCQKVIHPSSNIQKEYLVKTNKEITDNHLKTISEGTFIENTLIRPVKVKKVRRGTIKIVVKEGKKHEVRHLVKGANLEVLELKRIRIGGLHLGKLPLGAWKEMTEKEREAIFK